MRIILQNKYFFMCVQKEKQKQSEITNDHFVLRLVLEKCVCVCVKEKRTHHVASWFIFVYKLRRTTFV